MSWRREVPDKEGLPPDKIINAIKNQKKGFFRLWKNSFPRHGDIRQLLLIKFCPFLIRIGIDYLELEHIFTRNSTWTPGERRINYKQLNE